MSSSPSSAVATQGPCAACKIRRQKCTEECIFAPYFPPNDLQKFKDVHDVFGASNVSKILHKLHPQSRQAAVTTLNYQAQVRIYKPIYGCVGLISILDHMIQKTHSHLELEQNELASCMDLQRRLRTLLQPQVACEQPNVWQNEIMRHENELPSSSEVYVYHQMDGRHENEPPSSEVYVYHQMDGRNENEPPSSSEVHQNENEHFSQRNENEPSSQVHHQPVHHKSWVKM